MRASRPVLREAGGEIPPAYSPHGADPGERQDDQRAHLDLCPRRPAVWGTGAAGGAVITPRGTDGRASRHGICADFTGILQADAYGGYNELYQPFAACRGRLPRRCVGPMPGGSSLSWRILPPMPGAARSGGDLADRAGGGQADRRAVRYRAGINGLSAEERLRVASNKARRFGRHWKPGCAISAPACRARPPSPKPIDYMLKRWTGLRASSTTAGSA